MSADFFEHVLYRVYGQDDRLLYIGITSDENNRFAVHACQTRWWHEAARIEVEVQPYKDKWEAAYAERAAIVAEYPHYNQLHRAWGEPPADLEPTVVESRRVAPPCGFNRDVVDGLLRALADCSDEPRGAAS